MHLLSKVAVLRYAGKGGLQSLINSLHRLLLLLLSSLLMLMRMLVMLL